MIVAISPLHEAAGSGGEVAPTLIGAGRVGDAARCQQRGRAEPQVKPQPSRTERRQPSRGECAANQPGGAKDRRYVTAGHC
jgi:hypothetical protein